jgi:hypothetical protein
MDTRMDQICNWQREEKMRTKGRLLESDYLEDEEQVGVVF